MKENGSSTFMFETYMKIENNVDNCIILLVAQTDSEWNSWEIKKPINNEFTKINDTIDIKWQGLLQKSHIFIYKKKEQRLFG